MAALDPYIPDVEMPWDAIRVRHLYNRIGHGCFNAVVTAGIQINPNELVDQILDGVVNLPDPVTPYWSNWTYEDYNNDPNEDLYFEHKAELIRNWHKEHITSPFRAKLSRFWIDHFAAEAQVYDCNSWQWHYYDLLQKMSLGNFKDFVYQIGLSPAMLNYLNGDENIAEEPNENYARELMELFTMGEGNGYTQNDIVEVARALTGYDMNYCSVNVEFDIDRFDAGAKTIFGITDNFDYDGVVDLIFKEKAVEVSHYICSKIYKHFVYDHANEEVVLELAQLFRDSNWELLPVFKALLKSRHFYESQYINAKIKSPLDMMFQMYNAFDFKLESEITDDHLNNLRYYCGNNLGMDIMNPPNVAGWPGQRLWINENTLTARWQGLRRFFSNSTELESVQLRLRDLALSLSGNSADPDVITRSLLRYMGNFEPTDDLVSIAVLYFKGDIPQNYFDDGTWNLYWEEAPFQIILLLEFIFKLPEYQLN